MRFTFRIAASLLALTGVFPATAARGAETPFTVTKMGPPLNERVRSIFAPPTRAASPYAATAHGVFAFDAEKSTWARVFQLPADKGEILCIAGYAKASQPLYVAYSNGVAHTRDAGGEWSESAPEDFRAGTASASLCGLSVSPADRKVALLVAADRAWLTSDFGEHWQRLPLPEGLGVIGFGAIDQGSEALRIVLVSAGALYTSMDEGANWTRLASPKDIGTWASFGPGYVDFLSSNAPPRAHRLDLGRAAFAPLSTSLDQALSPGLFASDLASQRDLWVPTSDALLHVNLPSGKVSIADPAGQSPQALTVHPRKPGALYYANGAQVCLIESAAAASAPADLQLAYAPAETTALIGQTASGAVAAGTASIVDQVLQSEPSLHVALAAVMDQSQYNERDIRQWKQRVKSRNLLPNFRVLAGNRQSLTTRYETVFPGTTQVDDIHLNDDKTELDSYTFEVEWQLRDLLFDGDEVDVSRESRLLTTQRNDTIRAVTDLYYERIEALVKLRHASPQESLAIQIQAIKTTELLNEICGQRIFEAPRVPSSHP